MYAWPRICAAVARLSRSFSTDEIGSTVKIWPPDRSAHDLRPDRLEALHDPLAGLLRRLVVERHGPIADAPTMYAARAVALCTSPPTPSEFSP